MKKNRRTFRTYLALSALCAGAWLAPTMSSAQDSEAATPRYHTYHNLLGGVLLASDLCERTRIPALADEGTVLERTQLLLDPLQQLVAGNCHLHRDTDRMIARSVGDPARDPAVADSAALFSRAEAAERYVVWPMWPIAQQAAGVVVK